jgi:hypothetical protein
VTAAWVTIAVLLVGVPAAAWWLGGRRFWSRLKPGADPDPYGDVIRRHGLTPVEAVRLTAEVPRGTAYDDHRLRAAALDMARTQLEHRLIPEGASRTHRVLVIAFFVWVTGVLGRIVYLVAAGRPEDVNWGIVAVWVTVLAWTAHRRRGLRRTVELNQPTTSDRAAD